MPQGVEPRLARLGGEHVPRADRRARATIKTEVGRIASGGVVGDQTMALPGLIATTVQLPSRPRPSTRSPHDSPVD